MLKIRDLGINALPRGRYRMAACEETAACADYTPPDCDDCTATDDGDCDGTRDVCNDCTATGRPKYRAAGFTGEAVALLRQQLDDRLGQEVDY